MTRGSADQAAIAVATAAVIGLLDAALVITGTAGAKGLSISPAAVDAPNVIVIFVDTVRYDRRAIERALEARQDERDPLDRLARLGAPTGDIDQMLAEIDAGRR